MSDEKPKPEGQDARAAGGRPPGEGGQRGDPPKEGGKQTDGPGKAAGRPLRKRPGIVALLVLLAIAATVSIALLWRHDLKYVTSDDAYVDGVPEQVAPQISGRVARVLVDDNEDVKAGQLLVDIDAADYQVRLEQAQAALVQSRAQLAEARAQEAVYGAQLGEARASLGTADANATNAAQQLERYRRLKSVNAGAVSAEQLDSAVASAAGTEAQLKASRQAVSAAEAQQGYARSLIAAAQAGIGAANTQVAQAELTLSYTKVKARIDGRIASKTVAVGNIVNAGTPLMAVVPRDVYVTANLKETELDHVRRGQPARITVDAYPELKLTGHVDSVQPASGQVFSALPAQNATGNWVKVVQRVPVKIDFDRLPDDPGIRLAPGMSVEVSVGVR